MKGVRALTAGVTVFLSFLILPPFLLGQVSVLTQHNDNGRTGQNLNESALNTSNVNVNSFGKLFSRVVDGYIYAQPLYVPNLSIQGQIRNVVYVATEHNSVYAFDADNPATSAPLWQTNLGPSVPSSDICSIINDPVNCPYLDLIPEIGITGTPVIDPGSSTIYVVAKTKNLADSTYHFKLHALDLLSGFEKFGGPAEIAGTVNGTGAGSVNGVLAFNPLLHNNRPAMLLMNGVVYASFGSVGDIGDYHGWIFGYNSSTLAQVSIFNTTPNSSIGGGGIWQGGQGLLGLNSYIYLMTADGLLDINTGGRDVGDAFLKLNPANLSVVDYFSPSDQGTLNTQNIDLGSGGPMGLPNTNFIAGMGKDGVLHLLNTSNLGQYSATSNNDVQEFQATTGVFMGSPIYWNSPNHGPLVYLWGAGDYLKAFTFNGSLFQTSPIMQSSFTGAAGYSNAVPLSLSANGSQAGTGIVWSNGPYNNTATDQTTAGILRAFDATDLTHELWNSKQNAARDDFGNYAKFCPPTIANGKVYLATFSGQLVVYGLNPPVSTAITFIQAAAATPQTSPVSVPVSFVAPQSAGNMNIVVVGWNDATSTVKSVADSAGNAYSLAIGPTKGIALSQSIYFAPNIKGGQNTITVTFSQAAAYPDIRILEYSGLDSVSPLDVTSGTSGTGAASSSGAATTNFASELVFAANTVSTATTGAVAPFVSRIITIPDLDIAQDDIVGATGTFNASADLSPSGNWVMQMASFKAANSSPGQSPQVTGISPNSGPAAGGTVVTIAGANFVSGASVTFGSVSATSITVVSAGSITAATPPGTAGAVSVTVTNPGGLSAALANGFTYTATVPAAISFVQVAAAVPQSPVSKVILNYPSSQVAGDLNIVVVGWNDSSASVQSVIDSAGNVYSLAVGPTKGTAVSQSTYFAHNIAGGQNTVTVTFNQPADYPDIRILEYSGLDSVSPLDVTAGASGSGTASSSGAATTTFASELVFAANTVSTTTTGAAAPFVSRIITFPDQDIAQDNIVGATGSFNASAQLSPSGNWVMQMVTFKAAAAAPSQSPQITSIAPNSGPAAGGTVVTISGSNFAAGATVSFGSAAAINVTVVNAGTITATTPPGAAGAVTVTITNTSGLSGALANGFTYAAPAAITFIQVADAVPQSPVSSVVVNYPASQTAGNLNVVVVGWNDTTASVQSVSDSAGNTYKLAAGPTSGTGLRQSIYYAAKIAGGANTVTVTFNQAAIYPDVRILEYSGAGTLDTAAGASGIGTAANSGSVIVSGPGELLFAADTVTTFTSGAGSGFTLRIVTYPNGDIAADGIASAAGTYSAAALLSPSGDWVMQIVVFK